MEVSRWLFENHPESIINALLVGVDLKDRGLGKSTGVALASIGAAMIKPHQPIKITESVSCHNNYMMDRHLMNMVADIIHKLDLKCFVFDKVNNTITYKPTVNVRLKLEEII